jgi:hypothetical protein
MSEETLTVKKSAVLEAMKQCPQAKSVLETIFGEQVKPKDEWENVPLSAFEINGVPNDYILQLREPCEEMFHAPFLIKDNPKSKYREHYKIEAGKIWRRK